MNPLRFGMIDLLVSALLQVLMHGQVLFPKSLEFKCVPYSNEGKIEKQEKKYIHKKNGRMAGK
jgi:hypothetical protein